MPEKEPSVEAVLIGRVIDQAYCKNIMKDVQQMGLERRIHYYGFHKKPADIMGCFDTVVLTTYAETFRLAL